MDDLIQAWERRAADMEFAAAKYADSADTVEQYHQSITACDVYRIAASELRKACARLSRETFRGKPMNEKEQREIIESKLPASFAEWKPRRNDPTASKWDNLEADVWQLSDRAERRRLWLEAVHGVRVTADIKIQFTSDRITLTADFREADGGTYLTTADEIHTFAELKQAASELRKPR